MKTLLLLILLAATPLIAQERTVKFAFRPITSVTTSEARTVQVGRSAVTYHTIEVDRTSTSTCTFTVEGTISGINWHDLSGVQSCNTDTMIHIINRVVSQIRINVTAITGSGATATFYYMGVAE